jgi:hypothetical protein
MVAKAGRHLDKLKKVTAQKRAEDMTPRPQLGGY